MAADTKNAHGHVSDIDDQTPAVGDAITRSNQVRFGHSATS
jgi:hypothetical protein